MLNWCQLPKTATICLVTATFVLCSGATLAGNANNSASLGSPAVVPAAKIDPEMTFVLARLSMPGCEPQCAEWIAASGKIVGNTAALFKKFLDNPAYRKLPVVLDSSGGNINSALAMGRLIRKYQMNTAVGLTYVMGCNPFAIRDGSCKPSTDSRAYPAFSLSYNAGCFSACPFVLLGGVSRIADKDSEIGLHQPVNESHPYVDHFWVTWHMVNGRKVETSRKLLSRKYLAMKTQIGVTAELKTKLVPYFNQMGGSSHIFDEMAKAGPDKINLISWASGSREKLGLVTGNNLNLHYLIAVDHCKVFGRLSSNCVYIKQRRPFVLSPFERT